MPSKSTGWPRLTPKQLGCTHRSATEAMHLFDWDAVNDSTPPPTDARNVYNAYHPACSRCGVTIGQIVENHERLVAKATNQEKE
ncbi:hypothetical protein LCGC14_0552110 [marine sediment metagenome]|uniref:Uncharacterized protein n=1 Tax=marine sediment metagenome TaxID=412755 RepID=A0A0F9UXQ0_9ZZZZ